MSKYVAIITIVIVGLAGGGIALALDGSGTEQDPWRIQSLDDFNDFAADPNYWAGFTRLETDVNLAGLVYEMAVIAPDLNNSGYLFDGTPFIGVFDGNDHKITNLTIDDGGAGNVNLGLFGYIDGGEVRNLGLEGGSISGNEEVGGLVGINGGGSISNCYSTSSISGANYVGGLMGGNGDGSILNCYFTGDVSGSYAGGLAGWNEHASILNCYSTGDVSGEACIGGLVGNNYIYGSISNCYSTGDVSGEACIGGLVGENFFYGSISNCYSAGSVGGHSGVGGLVGINRDSISNCYSTGDVNGVSKVGGLVGDNTEGSISNCYSTGDVSGVDIVGGLAGWNEDGSILNCFWDTDTQTHGVTKSIGFNYEGTVINVAGLPTAQMQTRSTFTDANWDFINTWNIGENQTYPYLRTVSSSDINKDHITDFFDIRILCDQWLEEE